LPKQTEEEKQSRKEAIASATIYAIRVPFRVMETALKGFDLAEAMVSQGSPSSISDAGVGALALHAAVEGAWINMKINATELGSHPEVREMLSAGETIRRKADAARSRILELVNKRITP
jgi:glutamate formiminotransferase/formiminotetrahydrofolate cyclodeaminase